VQPVVALTIAGSDSGGGAGIQADLRTFSAFGVHGTAALTAVTAQNTLGVAAVHLVPVDVVEAQVRSVVEDFNVAAVKTGMLAQPTTVERVANLKRAGLLGPLVVDPVLVSTSGHVLMSDGGVAAYRDALIPLCDLVTPNLREAALLCDVALGDLQSIEDLVELAGLFRALGARYALVKGGHALAHDSNHASDVLLGPEGLVILDSPRVATNNDHGTGCSLASAVAAGLALGREMTDAVRDAKAFVNAALEGAREWRLGRGHGPIDHLGWASE
jgi:hydroxymethylpyrimidine/phosphomethylpyrimidine kinase